MHPIQQPYVHGAPTYPATHRAMPIITIYYVLLCRLVCRVIFLIIIHSNHIVETNQLKGSTNHPKKRNKEDDDLLHLYMYPTTYI